MGRQKTTFGLVDHEQHERDPDGWMWFRAWRCTTAGVPLGVTFCWAADQVGNRRAKVVQEQLGVTATS
jgi:hypothetical protein